MTHLTESTVEQAALAWLEGLGWRIEHDDTFHNDKFPDVKAHYILANGTG